MNLIDFGREGVIIVCILNSKVGEGLGVHGA